MPTRINRESYKDSIDVITPLYLWQLLMGYLVPLLLLSSQLSMHAVQEIIDVWLLQFTREGNGQTWEIQGPLSARFELENNGRAGWLGTCNGRAGWLGICMPTYIPTEVLVDDRIRYFIDVLIFMLLKFLQLFQAITLLYHGCYDKVVGSG